MPHENNMIAKTITDIAFAWYYYDSLQEQQQKKKTIFILRDRNLYWLNISETAQIQKKETSFVENGVAW